MGIVPEPARPRGGDRSATREAPDGRRHDARQDGDVEGFLDVVESAIPEGSAHELDVLIAGEDDYGHLRMLAAQMIEHLHARHAGHLQVEQHEIWLKDRHELQGLGATDGMFHGVGQPGEDIPQHRADVRFIFDDEDATGR